MKVIYLSKDKRLKGQERIYECPIKKTFKKHMIGDYIVLKNVKLVNLTYNQEEKQNVLAKVVKVERNVYIVDLVYMGVSE